MSHRVKRPPPAAGGPAPETVSLVNSALHRFPWPANPGQRYSMASPWLGIVNARGPWACWSHWRKDPEWLAVYRSLWTKPFWRWAPNDLRVLTLALWQWAAAEDYWGIVWGDPVLLSYELCRLPGLDPATVSRGIPALCEAGFVCYLTEAERLAVQSWRPNRSGGKTGQEGRVGLGDGGQVRPETETGTGTGTATGDRGQRQPAGNLRAPHPGSDVCASARARQRQGQGERDPQGHGQGPRHGQGDPGHGQGPEPASLPESDPGSGNGSPVAGTTGDNARSRSVSEAARLGELGHWQDPLAVEFGRKIFAAVKGREAPPDLFAASRDDRSIVGAFAAAWVRDWSKVLKPGQFDVCVDRACRDIAKKRGKAGVRDLGAVAMAKIIPGVVRTLAR